MSSQALMPNSQIRKPCFSLCSKWILGHWEPRLRGTALVGKVGFDWSLELGVWDFIRL